MEEVDLLRPLREFMSEPTRLGDRLAVALLPTDKSEKDEAAQKIRLLRGYGVYSIHYGWASMAIGEDSAARRKNPGIRWLALVKEIKDKVDNVLVLFSDPEKFETALNKECQSTADTENEIFHNIEAKTHASLIS